MGKTVRANISIPKDLKARMSECGDRVNWSRVASLAFEEYLLNPLRRESHRAMREACRLRRLARDAEMAAR